MEKEELEAEARFLQGMSMSFMVWLSSLDGFTFSVSNEILSVFPYDDYDLIVDRSDPNITTYSLHPRSNKVL